MERKIKDVLLISAVIVASFVAVIAFRYLNDWIAVDSCLDMGGSFDYRAMSCDTERSHEYVPYSVRHPHDGTSAAGGLITLGFLVCGILWMRVIDVDAKEPTNWGAGMKIKRREKDSLGVVEVPAGAMYGAQTQRGGGDYSISGMRAAGALVRAMGCRA